MRRTSSSFTLALLLACSDEGPRASPGASPHAAPPTRVAPAGERVPTPRVELPACPPFTASRRVGTVEHPELVEASGVAASRQQPGVLWVHNDSGDRPRVFATNDHGDDLGVFVLAGASAMDWEDVAIGRGPVVGRWYLYLGDIGDNAQSREGIRIYRVEEPRITTSGAPITEVEEIELQYPGGPYNAETLMVDPISGALLIVAKTAEQRTPVFQVQLPIDATPALLEHVADLDFGGSAATGGDISADGKWIAVRTYSRVLVWRRLRDEPVSASLAREACTTPLGDDGEAFAWLPTARGYVTLPEGNAAAVSRADW